MENLTSKKVHFRFYWDSFNDSLYDSIIERRKQRDLNENRERKKYFSHVQIPKVINP